MKKDLFVGNVCYSIHIHRLLQLPLQHSLLNSPQRQRTKKGGQDEFGHTKESSQSRTYKSQPSARRTASGRRVQRSICRVRISSGGLMCDLPVMTTAMSWAFYPPFAAHPLGRKVLCKVSKLVCGVCLLSPDLTQGWTLAWPRTG